MEGNLVNAVDPSGNIPSLGAIRAGDMSFSCRCGWIDWGHASPRNARQLIKAVRTPVNGGARDYKGVKAEEYGVLGLGVSEFAIVRKDLSQDTQDAVALGIFMEISERFEEYQLSTRLPGAQESYYSLEDLPSNLIGFYSALVSIDNPNGLTPVQQKNLIKPICGAVGGETEERPVSPEDIAWSEAVLSVYERIGLLDVCSAPLNLDTGDNQV